MLRTLWSRLTQPVHVDASRLSALETHVRALYDHVKQLEHDHQQQRQDELRRAAEHATMVDQLSRLYKRVAARIARESEPASANGTTHHEESVMELRRRLGR